MAKKRKMGHILLMPWHLSLILSGCGSSEGRGDAAVEGHPPEDSARSDMREDGFSPNPDTAEQDGRGEVDAGVDAGGSGADGPLDSAVIADSTICAPTDSAPLYSGQVELRSLHFKRTNGSFYDSYAVLVDFRVGNGFKSAGKVTVSGGSQTIEVNPESDGTYKGYVTQNPPWKGGDTLTVKAAGDVVPAMQGSIVLPTQVHVTMPQAMGKKLIVPLKSDFKVVWVGTSSGYVTDGLANINDVNHTVPPSVGHDTITVAELATVQAGDGVWNFDQTTIAKSFGCNSAFELVATTNSLETGDTPAGAYVTFQP